MSAQTPAKPVPGSIEYYDQIEGFWDGCDKVETWLNAHPDRLWNCSTIARRAKVDGILIYQVVDYLDRNGYIVGDGNGCWRKYCAKRA